MAQSLHERLFKALAEGLQVAAAAGLPVHKIDVDVRNNKFAIVTAKGDADASHAEPSTPAREIVL
jgi:hypothetical protein